MGCGNCKRGQLSQILSRFFLLLLLLQVKLGDAADVPSDSIVLGASLTGSQTRISKSGVFELGFFNLTNNNVKEWYVGIWYVTASQQTTAWVANRDRPLQNSSGVFNLTEDGSLVLSYGGSTVWSSKGNVKKPSSAVMTNSGNLKVLSAENTSESIWESFDHPGNTWLPGMKISVTESLTSWKSTWDPSPGPFGLQMDADGTNQFVLVWKNQIKYWQSGVWNGQIFSEVPEMTQNYIYDFSFFSNSNGSYKYFTYSVKPQFSYLSRFVLDESGEIRVYIMLTTNEWSMFWAQPREQCQVYDVCGAYGSCNNNNLQSCSCLTGFVPNDTQEWDSQQWSSGCVRKTPLKCSHAGNWTNTVGFVELSGKSTPPQWVQYKGQGQGQCQAACLGNCSCTAYAYIANSTLQACLIWFGELRDLSDTASNGISLFLLLDASDLPDSSGSKKKATLAGVVGGVAGGLVVIMALVFLFLWCCKRPGLSTTEYAPGTLTVFTYRELQVATKNFSERLGGGGFGSVFKGTLQDGSLVAVKKLEGVSQGEKQFRMEVSTIGTTQHVNLVRLRGFCTEGSGRLLVYEYMPNGCLSTFLFHKTRNDDEQKVLDWKTRFGIAVGTARGIVYLHEKCRDCIIHCDIKPENILLDSNFCPKVADFGLAKLLGREYSKVLTTMRGTRGYLAPEWLSGLPITVKADVYSFGMTLLEIIAGRRNMDGDSESSEMFFPAWAATQISSGNAMEVLDKKLTDVNDAEAEQVKRAAIVGGWCIQDDEDDRPTMSQALQILEGVVDAPAFPPLPLSLQTFALKSSSLVFYWDKDPSTNARNDSDHPSTPP
jgi:hypothetical protein